MSRTSRVRAQGGQGWPRRAIPGSTLEVILGHDVCHSLAIVPNVYPCFTLRVSWPGCGMKTKRRAASEPPNVAAACSSRAQGRRMPWRLAVAVSSKPRRFPFRACARGSLQARGQRGHVRLQRHACLANVSQPTVAHSSTRKANGSVAVVDTRLSSPSAAPLSQILAELAMALARTNHG